MFAIWGIWIERNQECKLLRFMSVALIWDMVFICAPISDIFRNWGAVLGGGHVVSTYCYFWWTACPFLMFLSSYKKNKILSL